MANRDVLYKFAFLDGVNRLFIAWDITDEEKVRYRNGFYRTIDGNKTYMELVTKKNGTTFFRKNPIRRFLSIGQMGGFQETDCHIAAKSIILKNWKKMTIHIPHKLKCPVCDICNEYDADDCILKSDNLQRFKLFEKYGANPVLEASSRKGGFVPDILFKDTDGNELWFEINTTHKVDTEKVWQGVPIIEVDIDSEEDIEWLYMHRNFYDGGKTHLFNMWALPHVQTFFCQKYPQKYEEMRMLYMEGDLGLGINDAWPYKMHCGETVISVYKNDREYFDWCLSNSSILKRLSKNCKKILGLEG